jgi:hypothetical protein
MAHAGETGAASTWPVPLYACAKPACSGYFYTIWFADIAGVEE